MIETEEPPEMAELNTTMTFRLAKTTKERLEFFAKLDKRSVGNLCNIAVDELLERLEAEYAKSKKGG